MTRLSEFVSGRSMAELYDAYWIPFVLDAYANEMGSRVSSGDRVLDLACGTGVVTGYAAKAAGSNGEVVGYDPTPDLLDAARAKLFEGAQITWIDGFGEKMPFQDASFDVVLCHQGLQYVTDREETFAEVARVLKPGGVFHAGVWSCAANQPAFGFVEDSLALHFGPEQKPVHAWAFGGLDELKRLAEGVGLAVERLEQVSLDCRCESIQRYVDVQIACAGRTDENGQLAMGLVDLEDKRRLSAIDGFSRDAHRALANYITNGALAAPFCSDELSARA